MIRPSGKTGDDDGMVGGILVPFEPVPVVLVLGVVVVFEGFRYLNHKTYWMIIRFYKLFYMRNLFLILVFSFPLLYYDVRIFYVVCIFRLPFIVSDSLL